MPWPQVASEAVGTFVVTALEVLKRLELCPEPHNGGGAENLEIGAIPVLRDACAAVSGCT